MERARIDGAELEYEVRGAGEPVVLVHGSIIGDAFAPLFAEPELAERYQLITYHRRGFAGSTHPDGPVSIEQHAADCRALMQHLGVRRAHLAGYSYGGPIVLQLALDAPEMVHSLALLEPALFFVPSAEQFMQEVGPIVQMYEAGDKRGAIDGFQQVVVGPEYRSMLDRALPGAFEQAVVDADTFFRNELPALGEWKFTQEDAAHITQPVLAVLGGESHTLSPVPVEIYELVQTWFPQTETFVLEDATHGLQIMNPRGMAAGLAGFFARHPLSEDTERALGSEPGGRQTAR
ncbi:alpha/beta fold hydrolase [Rubrobacter aplysinae]|uniref:alpha/beta fold hydrolase n=1 Tax=Rubrobacter aplysinae TaxID=909625 RepID=UPI00064C38B8|nr:alpha/beta hydrolase [Rubrobacter aplysinae]